MSNLYQIDVSFLSFNQHGFDVQWERICYEFFHEPNASSFCLEKISFVPDKIKNAQNEPKINYEAPCIPSKKQNKKKV